MKPTTVLTSGLAGAAAVTAIHETIRRVFPSAPRMDLLGMQSISKLVNTVGGNAPSGNKLYAYSIAADLLSNALYYSLSGVGKKKNVFMNAAILGLLMGVGAVTLPKPLGLNENYSSRTVKTTAITVGLYVIGGVVTATLLHFINRKKDKKPKGMARSAFRANQMLDYDE